MTLKTDMAILILRVNDDLGPLEIPRNFICFVETESGLERSRSTHTTFKLQNILDTLPHPTGSQFSFCFSYATEYGFKGN